MPPLKTKVIPLLNWLLYSNVFIALCALAMTAQTLFLLDKEPTTSPALLGLVFFSTWFIYTLHRLVSWRKLNARLDIPRFQIIGHYQSHLKFYAGFSIIGAMACFFYLKCATQLALLLPALLSLGYVLPFLGQKRLRLRDLHFVKIFLIAGVWSYVTVILPVLETGGHLEGTSFHLIGVFLERSLFIFIITLPFDLRDWKLDAHHAVKTIPTVLGSSKHYSSRVGINCTLDAAPHASLSLAAATRVLYHSDLDRVFAITYLKVNPRNCSSRRTRLLLYRLDRRNYAGTSQSSLDGRIY